MSWWVVLGVLGVLGLFAPHAAALWIPAYAGMTGPGVLVVVLLSARPLTSGLRIKSAMTGGTRPGS